MTINYIFDEDKLIEEVKEYVDRTYNEHYAKGIQVTEFIISNCDSPDFFRGNVLKYVARYGHKDGHQRKDLLKAIHYLIMLLNYHDRNFVGRIDLDKLKTSNTVNKDGNVVIPTNIVRTSNVHIEY